MKKTKNANKESNTFRHFFKKIVAFTIFFPYSFLFRIKMCNFAKLLENRYLIIEAPDYWNMTPKREDKLGKNFEEIAEKLGKRAQRLGKKLGKNRIEILRLIYENPFVSTVEMANRIGISTTAIDNNIKLMRNTFIKHIGPTNGGHWEIIKEDNE